MKRIAPIRLQYDPKTLWFDPGDLDISKGDSVVVTTARGREFGTAASDVLEVEDERLQGLKTPLRPVERIATEQDFAQRDEMKRLSEEAMPVFKELAAETNEAMRPVMVEYLFDGSKAVFLFEAEERTDFRELVRKLTSRLHVRVDMRQIGVRDEARIVGGLGHCGQELCCRRLGGEFCPVSIRMAKAQDLSLNPAQISGVCGRLMCCLRYEYDTYKDFKARAPKQNATISTPEGDFKVCELDTPHEVVVLRVDKGKKVRIPLSAFDKPAEGAESQRPRSIGDAYYDYANADALSSGTASVMASTDLFTRQDKLAEKGAVRHNPVRRKEDRGHAGEGETHSRRKRRVRTGHEGDKPARRAGGPDSGKNRDSTQRKRAPEKGPEATERHRRRRRRGGSKGASTEVAAQQKQSGGEQRQRAMGQNQANGAPDRGDGTSHRRARRRSHRTGGSSDNEQ